MTDIRKLPKREGWTLGIDVARYQAGLDMDRVREAGCEFVIAKASQGVEMVDPFFFRFAAEAQANVLHSGAYHFFDPSKQAGPQAKLFTETAEDAVTMIPALDFETLKGVSPHVASRRALEWIYLIEEAWKSRVIFYSNPYFIRTSMDLQVTREIMNRCDLWLAHYTTRPTPDVPEPFTDWKGWQFDGDAGYVFDREGKTPIDCDFNWYRGDLKDFSDRWYRGPRP